MNEPYECWVWLVHEPDGSEGPVAMIVTPELGPMVLQHRRRAIALELERYARMHEEETGRPVRLAYLVEQPEPS